MTWQTRCHGPHGYRIQTGLGMDRVAKSSEFVEAMLVDHFPKAGLRLVVGEGGREVRRSRNGAS